MIWRSFTVWPPVQALRAALALPFALCGPVDCCHGLTPSHYMRKMLVMQLLGEPIHTEWQKAIGKISADTIQMERD